MTAPDIAQIPMSSELAATLARGAEFAGVAGAQEVSLEHLLAALCDDPDALAVLDASQISGAQIKGDVISRVLEAAQPSGPPLDSLGVSEEVRRILEAAAAAARGSRRRDINGAIVLAAIVGDARSVAAEILEAHGLTFENAIRALQSALTPRESAPQPQPPVADDVLARARERVQSRSAPSLRDIMKDMPRPAPMAPPFPAPEMPPPNVSFPEPPLPQPPAAEVPLPQPPFPEPTNPPPDASPAPEPPRAEPRPSASTTTPYPGPAMPFPIPAPPAREAKSPAPSEPEPRRPSEPSFGAPPAPSGHPSDAWVHTSAPAPAPAQVPFPSEPALPLPSRSAPQPGASGQRPSFDLPFPSSGAPAQPPADPGANPAPPPPREVFDLPPRPQPSRVQPPPIPPAPGLGGPASPRARPQGMQPAAPPPPFGPAGPSLSPSTPAGMPPGGAPPGARQNPGPNLGQVVNPNVGQDTGFRPGAPLGAPAPTPAPTPQQPAQKRMAKRSKSASVEAGQLAENIPRSMRVGKTVRAEVRIAKASIKGLTEGLDGSGQVWHHTVAITKAMSVRLRAPDGGFFIESVSPETQWIENNLGYASDDFASWRFQITPQTRGWSDLQIIVSARTVGADGVAAETALPDQIVEVKVRANIVRTIGRLVSWTIAAVIGGALATFGESGMAIVTTLMKKFGH